MSTSGREGRECFLSLSNVGGAEKRVGRKSKIVAAIPPRRLQIPPSSPSPTLAQTHSLLAVGLKRCRIRLLTLHVFPVGLNNIGLYDLFAASLVFYPDERGHCLSVAPPCCRKTVKNLSHMGS
ncbi:unnamed protein product [Somion occarium]|uniref:Uncharacterized protein n=1 Tax=Somion occarium TaxID=3059160 RepID=A0ABP1EBI9_9APHY